MKKDYTLYTISRIVKGRRDYLAKDPDTFSDKFNKAHFFDSKKEAMTWLKSATAYDILTYDNDVLRKSQPAYELLSVTMKISKELCQS